MKPHRVTLDYVKNSLNLEFNTHQEVDDAYSQILNPMPTASSEPISACTDPSTINAYQYVIRALYRSGEKIAAIRFYRQMTGLGLKTAKDACDKIAETQNPF